MSNVKEMKITKGRDLFSLDFLPEVFTPTIVFDIYPYTLHYGDRCKSDSPLWQCACEPVPYYHNHSLHNLGNIFTIMMTKEE